MSTTWRDRLGALFEQALELEGAERRSWIAAACGGNEPLRLELVSLLASHDEAPGFLEGATGTLVQRALASLARAPEGPWDPAVARRYQILDRLGGGGMGVVYEARDQRLGRQVALKFLAPYLTADPRARERLLAEARAASVLDHPNVAVIHEIEETDSGQLYISMGCYRGDTLRDVLARGRPSVEATVEIGRQIADALGAAHAAGIVHRDVKPSNVLLADGGTVKLVDFGISVPEEAELTEDIGVLGTVHYMSPEQARGETVDRRSDVWSVGVLLYELLTGARPFPGEDDRDVLRAIRDDEPEALGVACPEAPPALEAIVETCLRKDRADRYESGRSLAAALTACQAAMSDPGGADEGHRRPHAVAVLPFEDRGLARDHAHLPTALTQDLIARLSVLQDVRVTAWASARTYRDRPMGLEDIRRELGVRTLVDGGLATVDGRILMVVSCVDAAGLGRLWSEELEVDDQGLAVAQARIADRIAGSAGARPTGKRRRSLLDRGTRHPAAYARWLAGRKLLDGEDEDAVRAALQHFQAITDAEPGFALAWCGVAEAWQALTGLLAAAPEEAYPAARAAAETALSLDGDLADAHCVLALNLAYHRLDLAAAEEHFLAAIRSAPSHAAAHGFYGELLRNQGRFDEALAEVRVAQALNPRIPSHELEEGIILYVARRYDQALDRYEQLRRSSPGFKMVDFFVALVQTQMGRYDDALRSLQVLDPRGLLPDTRALRGYVYGLTGRRGEARDMIASLQASLQAASPELDPSPFHAAVIHVALGEHDEAIDLLWEAFRRRTWQTALLVVEPMVDPLRHDPRFQALLEAMGMHRPPLPVTPIARRR